MAFIGGFEHAPNVDAAKWLMSSLMPRIRRTAPEMRCYLVGSGFPPELEQIKSDGINVIGQVARLSDIFDRVRLTIAPLSYGAGVKGKILESLAAGVPCVYTGTAAEGMSLPAELEACRGDNDRSISDAVKRLHEDAALNRRCSSAGLAYVEEELSEMKLDHAMQEVFSRGTTRPISSAS
jgi:glycosyltransferase involved in cell wall biosynthesis